MYNRATKIVLKRLISLSYLPLEDIAKAIIKKKIFDFLLTKS